LLSPNRSEENPENAGSNSSPFADSYDLSFLTVPLFPKNENPCGSFE
jgi:hypothetical protein